MRAGWWWARLALVQLGLHVRVPAPAGAAPFLSWRDAARGPCSGALASLCRFLGFNALTGKTSDDDLAPLNKALRHAVTAVGGHWLELGQPYRGRAGLVQNDGEHPTPAGQQAIAAAVLERLDDRG